MNNMIIGNGEFKMSLVAARIEMTPEVLWDDLTSYQQWIVEEGRKPGHQMPMTIENGEQWMTWFRSLRNES